jgi:hypothetical protein
MAEDAERRRMRERDAGRANWGMWGSYLSDRQWGTVREDYSAEGDAWNYFPFELAAARVYRWGEDGLLGICDDDCRLCFAPAFWNGRDIMLKERPFGLSNPQGNHGEDLKEEYYHIDNTPTHSFMRGLYRYAHAEFPYRRLIDENARRSRTDPEFELVDTGIFDERRFFDIEITYAKAAPEDICIQISVTNRGPEAAALTVLPTLWFRNTWGWGEAGATRPEMHLEPEGVIAAAPWGLPISHLHCDQTTEFVFTENETNNALLYGSENVAPFTKDAFHRAVVHGEAGAVNPAQTGTKAAAVYRADVAAGGTWTIRLRLCKPGCREAFGAEFEHVLSNREAEADAFYESLVPGLGGDEKRVFRRANAGLLWCKKFYYYPVAKWLDGDPNMPAPPPERHAGRNAFWKELHAHDIISMPDSWEYPYFCAWDLMFQSVAFAALDPATAKRQSMLLRGERYTSPSSRQPAYEWAFSDANPPIGGWAVWRIYSVDRAICGKGDVGYLERAFHKLLMEYAWWANRVDQTGDNVFEGGFLGLDNIGIFDRRYPLPDGSRIEQSDGTAWMAAFALNMLNIALELAKNDPPYEDIADKFLNDFIYLAAAVNKTGDGGITLWDEEDGFYYDVLKRTDGSTAYLKTRSVAGLTPLFAVESFDEETVMRFPLLRKRVAWFATHRPHFLDGLHHIGVKDHGKVLVSLVPPERLRRICQRLFDESEFLSPHGIRSLSRYYLENPYTFREGEKTETLAYSPGASPVAMFGGNSNWRGPVWMPMNFLLIEAFQKFGFYFGDTFRVEFPSGSGKELSLWEVSLELERRLVALLLEDAGGRRPFRGSGGANPEDWRELIAFHEYFHGDNGKGLGASHQTGWTALVAKMIRQLHRYGP